MATSRFSGAAALVITAALVAAGCGGDDGGVAAPEGPVTELTITSPNSTFDIREFQVAVGEPVTITYDNTDNRVAHNIRFVTPTEPQPATDLAVGPDVQELTFTAAEPGEYLYVCDVHPRMRGTVIAS